MLAETFLSASSEVTIDDLAGHFAPALRAAAEKSAGLRTAQQWLDDPQRQPLIDALREAGRVVAFSSGVECLAPFHLDLQSPSFQRQRVEELTRQATERRTAQQVEHLQRAGELLRKFEEIRKAAPELSPGQILQQISPADRGSTLDTLLLAGANAPKARQSLYLVAGHALVKVRLNDDPTSATIQLEPMPLPETLGPLRSIQPDDHQRILIGARQGVLRVSIDDPTSPIAYADSANTSPLGFSQVVEWNQGLWACHSGSGLVGWKIDQPDSPIRAIRPQELADVAGLPADSGARHLLMLDEMRLLFAVGDRLITLDRAGELRLLDWQPSTAVQALLLHEEQLLVVHEDGQVSRLDRGSLQWIGAERRASSVSAAGLLPWLGDVRLLLAQESGTIVCAGVNDQLLTQYASPHTGLRMLAASAALA